MLNQLTHALMVPVHAGERAAHFMGGLSHQNNLEMQAEYLAKDLRARGVPDHLAWPAAHQYAQENNIAVGSKEHAALTALVNVLRMNAYHHR